MDAVSEANDEVGDRGVGDRYPEDWLAIDWERSRDILTFDGASIATVGGNCRNEGMKMDCKDRLFFAILEG